LAIDLDANLNEKQTQNVIKAEVANSERKQKALQSEFEGIIERWDGKLIVLKKELEKTYQDSHGKLMAGLVESYVQRIMERNRKMVEVVRVKEEIESKIEQQANKEEIE